MGSRLGSPDPTAVRAHREIPTATHAGVVALGAGAALTSGAPCAVAIPVAGAIAWKVRFKATAGGVLTSAYLRPDTVTPYEGDNPGDVAVTANAMAVVSVASHFGEGWVRVTFTPSADGVVTYLDASQVP